jgi:hypothetical protein
MDEYHVPLLVHRHAEAIAFFSREGLWAFKKVSVAIHLR